jgi:DNA-binding CsgD family transcriptional regulator
MLVFDGALCVGWFGAVRWADAPTFKPHELRLARKYEKRWIRCLTAAHRDEKNILEGAAAHIVCDLSGAVVAHSYQVGHWLTRDRRRRVRESVRFAAVKGHARAVIGNYAWRVARLEGSSGDLVYLNAPLGSFGAVNLSVLSTRQHQVAQLIALGLTTKEVAEELGLSPHTVKQHLSRAYRLLGVRRREQLIERLCR